jgi:hypothetical protein
LATSEDINAFAQELGGDRLGLVEHQPEPDMLPTHCFTNVQRKVQRDGGRERHGWIFQIKRVVALPGREYLVAIHHAVWHNPDGRLIDVTPFHDDPMHHPVTEGGSVVFLLSTAATPLLVRTAMVPLPSKFFAIGDDVELSAHVRELRRAEYRKMQEIRIAAANASAGSTIDSNGAVIVPERH